MLPQPLGDLLVTIANFVGLPTPAGQLCTLVGEVVYFPALVSVDVVAAEGWWAGQARV